MDTLVHLIETYKYAILIPLSIFEGPIVIVIGGFLSSINMMNPVYVYIIGATGDIVGDSLFYFLGRISHRKIYKYGRYIGINPESLDKTRLMIVDHYKRALITSKLVHGIGFTGLIAAGVVKAPYKKFLKITAIVALLQSAVLLFIGMTCGGAFVIVDKYINGFAAIVSAIAIAVIGILVLYKFKFKIWKKYDKSK